MRVMRGLKMIHVATVIIFGICCRHVAISSSTRSRSSQWLCVCVCVCSCVCVCCGQITQSCRHVLVWSWYQCVNVSMFPEIGMRYCRQLRLIVWIGHFQTTGSLSQYRTHVEKKVIVDEDMLTILRIRSSLRVRSSATSHPSSECWAWWAWRWGHR